MSAATGCYAGIGSRETPAHVLDAIYGWAGALAKAGWTLRSGAAPGADTAFEDGARAAGGKVEIYLPWNGFSGHTADERIGVIDATKLPRAQEARSIAASHHPAWGRLRFGSRTLHTRNIFTVLGQDLDDPVDLVVCYAPNPICNEQGYCINAKGGTGQAIRAAAARGIPVLNAALPEHWQRIETLDLPAPASRPGFRLLG